MGVWQCKLLQCFQSLTEAATVSVLNPSSEGGVLFLIPTLQRQQAHSILRVYIVSRLMIKRVCSTSLFTRLTKHCHRALSCSHVFLKVYCVSNLNDTCFPPSDLCVDKLDSTAGCVNVRLCRLTDSAERKLPRIVIMKHRALSWM